MAYLDERTSMIMAEMFYSSIFPLSKRGLCKGLWKSRRRLFRKGASCYLKCNVFFLHRDSEIMQQKQKAANERKSLQAEAK